MKLIQLIPLMNIMFVKFEQNNLYEIDSSE